MQNTNNVSWRHPIAEQTPVEGDQRAEVTPFVFNNRLYRLENFVRSVDFPGEKPDYRFFEDGFRIRDVEKNRIVSVPLLNHYFAVAFPWENYVYVYAGDYEENRPWWHIRNTVMLRSDDLITWSKPEVVLQAEGNERIFNYAVCRARGKFYMLYETNDSRWPPPFTLRFCESDDLINWRKLSEEHIYGLGKYTGGPALYYDEAEDYFYCLYVAHIPGGYENRITRSQDLINWEDAHHPVVTFDPNRFVDPIRWPGAKECSSSDIEMCEYNGKTYIYWLNGNQQGACRLYQSVYDGGLFELLRRFFETD
ncbi:MAG: hypothetical protein GX811_06755 [Lentisphaerae bacterium]|nr:hypothetical protein [Lentisphaerota bacterium]